MTDHVTCYESDEPVLTQIYDPNGNALTMGEIVARMNDKTESSGTSAMFDDYCDTLSLLTKYADKRTLKDRVQAVLSELANLRAVTDLLPRDAENKPVPPLTRLWFVHPELNQIWPSSSPRINPVVVTVRSLDDVDDSYEIEYTDCYQTSEAAAAAVDGEGNR